MDPLIDGRHPLLGSGLPEGMSRSLDPPLFTMSAGPIEVTERVLHAISAQTLDQYDPLFIDIYHETTARIAAVFQTRNDVIIQHGEAVLALESAGASTIEPGDKCLVLVSGPFGKGYGRHVVRHGGELIELEVPFNESIPPETVEKMFRRHPDIKVMSVVHCDTPAGTLNPIHEICPIAKEHGALTIVDAVSSLGGHQLLPDEWGVDILIAGPQKSLGGITGAGLVAVSEAAWHKMLSKSTPLRGSVLSMLDWKERWLEGGRFPYTPMVHQVYALNAAMSQILEKGIGYSIARHHAAGVACRAGIKAMGLQLWPASEDIAADCVTAVAVPDGLSEQQIVGTMRRDQRVAISGGLGDLIGKVFRIGHMGKMAQVLDVVVALAALEKTLVSLGMKVPPGAGVSAALATWVSAPGRES
jgi:pyridoxamine--pyruvate transaminase